jgi:2-polyprenyl-3-methyl-5-hydroxy-6-metoxy-1,4-benzoquinol methylase
LSGIETTNYEKFQTSNPVVRRLFDNFFRSVAEIVGALELDKVLDAGCGEGETIERLDGLLPHPVTGVDLNADSVGFARQRLTEDEFSVDDVTDLPFPDDSFDLTLCLEVLEHLPRPELAVQELSRVSSSDLVLSVPHEPWFRLGSLARGKYVKGLGNHPEHVNHWNPSSFRDFLSDYLDVVEVRRSTPWVIAHCRV